jgi:hypothetical protein
MDTELLKDTIKRELPGLLREDPGLRAYVLELTRQEYAGRLETEDRFYQMLGELRHDREEQARKWQEQRREWKEYAEEQARKWQEQRREWKEYTEEQARKWEEQRREWKQYTEEQGGKWEEQNRKWEEQNRKWDAQRAENREEFQRVHEEIMALARKQERSIGALGARWGMQTEAAFRNALAGILEESFGVEVRNISEYDDEGVVFGRPEQVELDVIVKNGVLLICELKSSVDKAGMYIFERKARFYERRHQRKADRLIVISPMIDARAQKVAGQLGVETYSDSLDVESL